MLIGTTEVAAAAAREWDVLVIGAGPAGGVAALVLARCGARVLLVDRAAFPREKACGCCLAAQGESMLREAGVRVPASGRFGGVLLRCGRRSAAIPSQGGVVVTRRDLDGAIVQAAIRAGAAFIDSCVARVVSQGPGGVAAALGGQGLNVRARAVIAADGIGGASLSGLPEFRPEVAVHSRFGAAVTFEGAPGWIEPGLVHMAVGAGGYVGAVRLPGGRAHLGAALDPTLARRLGGPSHAAAAILRSTGVDAKAPPECRWHGTPSLTRSRRVQSGRVLAIGDAAGYVEPFTGEGMTWAISGALAVVPHVQAALVSDGTPAETWPIAHRRLLAGRHRACRAVSMLVRLPRLAEAALVTGTAARVLARLAAPRRPTVAA
ncbi:MAG: FAD-dependent monooxygenase [Phycisphaerales bacterium]|nr:FAD-dependent monooxygenase [Phycisphaerales bacterium]